MTESEFGKIVAFLEGAWGVEMSGKQRDAYWLILHGEPGGAALAEAVRISRSSRSRFGIPKPGELLGADDSEPGLLAWHELVDTIERYGHYESVLFEDGAIGAVVDAMGGWLQVSDWPLCDAKEMRFVQREFERLYTAMSKRNHEPRKCIGFYEQQNRGAFPVREPIRIGNGYHHQQIGGRLKLLGNPEADE